MKPDEQSSSPQPLKESYQRLPIYRRTYIVDRHLQWKIILFSFHVSAMTCLAIYFISMLLAAERGEWSGGIVLALILLIFFPAMKLSHTIAGPVHHMKSHIEAMAQGPVEKPLRLRKTDSFKELAEKINRLQDSINKAPNRARPGSSA